MRQERLGVERRAGRAAHDVGRVDEIYAKHTGKTTEEVHRDMERDRFFSSEQAVEYGLIDKVISEH